MDLVKYTTIPIMESLLKLDPNLNRIAVECFECVMRYMGDLPITPELNEVKCVYTILMVRKRKRDNKQEKCNIYYSTDSSFSLPVLSQA